jgi:hypothetical protein
MTLEGMSVPRTLGEAESGKGRGRSAKLPRTRRRTWQQFGLATLTLAYVLGIAVATLVLGGVVLHALVPNRSFDIFAAVHNDIVLGVLLALLALWLLPPYPWAASWPSETGEPGQPEVRGGAAVSLSTIQPGRRLVAHSSSGAPMQ